MQYVTIGDILTLLQVRNDFARLVSYLALHLQVESQAGDRDAVTWHTEDHSLISAPMGTVLYSGKVQRYTGKGELEV